MGCSRVEDGATRKRCAWSDIVSEYGEITLEQETH